VTARDRADAWHAFRYFPAAAATSFYLRLLPCRFFFTAIARRALTLPSATRSALRAAFYRRSRIRYTPRLGDAYLPADGAKLPRILPTTALPGYLYLPRARLPS